MDSLLIVQKVKYLFLHNCFMYFTKTEQILLAKLPRCVFTLDEVRGFARRYLVELLNRLARKNALVRVKKGVYFVNATQPEARFKIALATGGYIGFASALKHYGLLDEELSRVFVATQNKRGLKAFAGFDVEYVPLYSNFYGIVESNGLRFSTMAKTFFDCFKKPLLAGGYGKLLRILKTAELSAENWRELLYYLWASKSKSLKQKTGFLLQEVAPSWFLKKLLASVGKPAVVFLDYGSQKGFDKKWGVYYGSRA